MLVRTLLKGGALTVYDVVCAAGPADRPFVETHRSHSVSYVRSGSFGCVTRGESHEYVAGALMLGRPGGEYMATHEHHPCGDECLSFKLSPELADSVSKENTFWDLARVPPLPELVVLGQLAQAAAEGRASVGVEEAGLMLVHRLARSIGGNKERRVEVKARERRRAVEAALWLEANAGRDVGLEDAARFACLSPYHFLRTFKAVLGVTPHQYLLRARLKRAAKLLAEESAPVTEVALEAGFADLSNFVRTFRRAAGVSPRAFRRTARGERQWT